MFLRHCTLDESYERRREIWAQGRQRGRTGAHDLVNDVQEVVTLERLPATQELVQHYA
jgi:hypothetical protein